MSRHGRAPDHARNTVRKLLAAGERLPASVRREILALKDAAIAPLLDLLGCHLDADQTEALEEGAQP
jgi:hypothetical protein